MMSLFSPGTELKRFRTGTLPKAAVAVLLFIPLIYGALYLWAFWAPTDELKNLPVALVNEDIGAVLDGEQKHAGDDLVDELLDGGDLKWIETDAADAATGVADGDYYFSVTIPQSFSEDAISVGTDAPVAAEVAVEYNDANSFLATTLGKSAMQQLRSAVAEKISEQTADTMLVGLNEAGDGIREAADGAGQLADGLETATDGANTLTVKLGELADGAGTLNDGAGQLAAGAGTLASGLGQLSGGAGTLADGVGTLNGKYGEAVTGSGQIAAGSAELAAGFGDAAAGAGTLAERLGTLAAGAGSVNDGVQQLAAATAPLAEQLPQLAAGSAETSAGAGAVSTGSADLSAALAQLTAALESAPAGTPASAFLPQLQDVSASAAELSTGATRVAGGAEAVDGGVQRLAGNAGALGQVSQLAQGSAQLADGSQQAAAGATQLAQKLGGGAGKAQQLADGAGTLAGKLGGGAADVQRLADGAQTLAGKSGEAAAGAHTLASGAGTLSAGTAKIADGSGQLADGAGTLSEGATKLSDGAGTLSEKLTEGGEKIPELGQSDIDEKASVMGQPVALAEHNDNDAGSFGAGFAPFFIALATFVGALISWLILRALPTRALAAGTSGFRAVMTGFLPAMAIGLGQVIIMMLVLVYGIGLRPVYWVATSLFIYLVTLAFLALQQMFIIVFGAAAGRVISLVLLMLQLSSSGGTYPVETTPAFFQALHPWMPASYVVSGLRELISGGVDARLWIAVAVMAGVLIVSLAISALSAGKQRVWSMKRLYPELVI